ncbi:T9SS type B sorting domain-containing protein [Christiangramia sediminis]|uniref:T9SS type B sorting domain-containing protein n=1 Tax=Christiangramia sediminis TaxID=2881336 RepID=A0A9X1RVD9_9FLAO|nr:T9SS type B sorting domain-containing protein [Christiangramia sediminis]MCB7480096.1 T9SS type B sorting domain-containing protein [Christiangramia sediminis]
MKRHITALFFLLFLCLEGNAQLGFCTGSKGDPIFQEDFGSGNSSGNELGAGVTSYRFVRQDPQDGEYTISADIGNTITSWHNYIPQTTISGGKALIVNADFNPGKFYEKKISGLCENTTYEFSAFLMNVYNKASNVCANDEIPNNVKFEIWDETNSFVLKSGDTGDIFATNSPIWEQYALTFQSEPGQEAVILKMYNNGEGGCGNDLAIDDIIFSSCGDLTEITTQEGNSVPIEICEENSPFTITIKASPDNSVYEEHYYQWQESSNSEDWQDITGANTQVYETGPINNTTYFRVKVAEDIINLSSNECSSASEAFKIKIIQKPLAPVSSGDINVCGNDDIPALQVNTDEGMLVNWYDAEIGGNLLAENTNSYIPETEGTYYAEAVNADYDCAGSLRTAVTLAINSVPEEEDEELQICPGSDLQISAGVSGFRYVWNTGETSEAIRVDTSGIFSVEIITDTGCSVTKTINIKPVDNAQISEVKSEGETVTIIPEYEGQFLYSLDGQNFQGSNVFRSLPGGVYTAYIKDLQECNLDFKEFPHIVIPAFISPNNDGINDRFELKGIEYFDSSEIQIFDRYGKLLKIDSGKDFIWNGQFEGVNLPADDYWYRIEISGFKDLTGHFSLMR